MQPKSSRAFLWAVLLLVHGALTLPSMLEVGLIGIFEQALATWPARQVFSDLTMALIGLNLFITADARARKVTVWPVWVASLALGSFAPLAYLLWRDATAPATGVTGNRSAVPA